MRLSIHMVEHETGVVLKVAWEMLLMEIWKRMNPALQKMKVRLSN